MNSHLSPRELLHYVDGELPGRRNRSAQAHLLSCWQCRTELERLEQDISLIVDAQNRSYLPAMPPPARPWASFEELAATLPSSHFFSSAWGRLASYFSYRGLARWTVAVVTLLCVLVTALWLLPARLSAEGVLHKLDAADLVRTRVVAGQAIRQRIRVKRIDRQSSAIQSSELEFWKSGGQSVWRGEDSNLHRLYRLREIDAELPLSASACERWLLETGAKAKVSVNGGAVEIHAAGKSHDLESVNVRVSSQDWRVQAMQLVFADSIFDVSELDLTVLKKDELSRDLLGELERPNPANNSHVEIGSAITTSTAKVAAMELSSVTPGDNLAELELQVQVRLHEIGADLSEPIELKLAAPKIVVSAAGASDSRKQQLAEMFGGDSRIRLDLDASASPGEVPVTAVVVPRPGTFDGPDKALTSFFGESDVQERFTRATLASDEAILSRFYALRNLAERWPAEVEVTLSHEAQAELRSMTEDHTIAIRSELPGLKSLLTPLIERFCNDAAPSASNPGVGISWPAFAANGLSTARVLDRSLRASLTTSANAAGIVQTCPSISAALSSLESELANLPAAR